MNKRFLQDESDSLDTPVFSDTDSSGGATTLNKMTTVTTVTKEMEDDTTITDNGKLCVMLRLRSVFSRIRIFWSFG